MVDPPRSRKRIPGKQAVSRRGDRYRWTLADGVSIFLGCRPMVCLGMLLVLGLTGAAAAAERPNIVVLVADDLGWGDVGYHGANIRTPNLDRLADQGVRLERFYACSICTPTRAGLLTGRYPIRFGLMRAVIPPWRNAGLPADEATLPERLADAGYEHRGCFGKWHLGHRKMKYHPLRQGFTRFEGHYNGAIDYFTHKREGEVDWHVGYEPSDRSGYTTDLIADAAVRFIRDHAGGESPFFCYVPFNAPHAPLQAPEDAIAAYEELKWNGKPAPERRRTYAAMVTLMDRGVGRILEALDETGVREQTLVWFFSDNGGTGRFGDNGPLRGTKQDVFEGGVRTPSVVRWPGGLPSGRIVESPIAYIDLLPTLLRVAGVEDPGGKPLDGLDVLDVLRGEGDTFGRELYHYWGQRGPDRERIALMDWPWKLVVLGPSVADPSAKKDRRKLLFRLDRDRGEEESLTKKHPDRVDRMYERLAEFRRLQPDDGLPPYGVGRNRDYKVPEHWDIRRLSKP